MQKFWEDSGSTNILLIKIKLMIEAYLGISDKKESGSFEELLSAFSSIGGDI